jgi:hypothetical protein
MPTVRSRRRFFQPGGGFLPKERSWRGARPLARKPEIEFGDGAINCVVRNMTELGAILDVTSSIGIPDHFTLALRTDGRRKYCRTVWWNEKRIGVALEYRRAYAGEIPCFR